MAAQLGSSAVVVPRESLTTIAAGPLEIVLSR
jgi:hypothetical protein